MRVLHHRPLLHLLHLVLEVEVGLIKVVDTDVTVLTAGSVAGSLGMAGNGVERAEMTADASNLVFEDFVVEAGFELSLSAGGPCDITRLLATTEDDEVLLCCDSARVQGSVRNVGLEDLEGVGLDELGRC